MSLSRRMLVVDAERSVVTFDVSTGQRVASFSTIEGDHKGDWPRGVHPSLSPDGTKLAMESLTDQRLACPLLRYRLLSQTNGNPCV
jgi:hypothetical protein